MEIIVDKKQISKLCEQAESLEKKINQALSEDEKKFFVGFEVFKIKAIDFVAVRINSDCHIHVNGYTSNYDCFCERDIEYIEFDNKINERVNKAIEGAKDRYKESIGIGAIAIKKMENVINSL